jgi:hypothetical protein
MWDDAIIFTVFFAVGGTTIGNVNGAAFDEYLWNDPDPSDPSGQNWGTTGGGISEHFDLPSYQNGVGVPHSVNGNRVGRGVPDVAIADKVNKHIQKQFSLLDSYS